MAGRRSAGPWGWHRLDPRWVERLIDLAHVGNGDLVVDVGAGDGAITARLVARGARVVAVELHPTRVDALRRRFAHDGRVVVVRADAADLRLPRRPFTVVANPPFAVTTALLTRLTHPASRLERAAIVLPSYAAARWAGGRGTGGANTAQRFDVRSPARVPRHAFRPPPPGDAAVLVLTRRTLAVRR